MATSSHTFRNIDSVYNFYKESLDWNNNTPFKLIKFNSTIQRGEAVNFIINFKIGNCYLIINSWSVKIDINHLKNIKNCLEWESYLTMNKLIGDELITEIVGVYLTDSQEEYLKIVGEKI